MILGAAAMVLIVGLGGAAYLYLGDDQRTGTETAIVAPGPEPVAVFAADDDTVRGSMDELAEARPPEAPVADELPEQQHAEDEQPEERRRRQRTPPPERSVAREELERERMGSEEEAIELIQEELAQADRQPPAAQTPVEEPLEQSEPDPETRQDREAEASAVAEQQDEDTVDWRPQAPEYVRAWELPLAVRRELPELRMSIHVYTPRQEDRFVLINGERYLPGDRVGSGARLVDIRPEGAVIDFREHRFLLEP